MYEGEWSMGKAEGFGAFYKDGELRFKGHFKNDLPNKNWKSGYIFCVWG